jgi:Flp pilus assembly protein TadD
MGRHAEAVSSFKEALSIQPSDDFAHYQLGLTYLQIGDKESAMVEYKTLKKLNSHHAEQLLREIEK